MADVRIDDQQLVGPPTDIDVSEDVVVTLRKVLHNSGPYGPVDVSISASVSAPPDCTATPGLGNPTSASLPVSANVVKDETWTIHCDARSQHVFSFVNQITIEDPGVVDPNLGNNLAFTELTVDVWALADLKMVDQQVFGCDDLDGDERCDLGEPLLDPPVDIPSGQNVPLMVRTRIHNNGPFGPVDAQAETIATAPPGCQIHDPGHVEIIHPPAGVTITVNAPFTIWCEPGLQHTFSFDNTVTVNQQHVRDPNDGNDTVHTELTVMAS